MQRDSTQAISAGDGRLWLISSLLALLLLVGALFAFGLLSVSSLLVNRQLPPIKKAPEEQVVIVLAPKPSAATLPSAPPAAPTQPRKFARTSADQNAVAPEKADFIGDRDTTATSDQIAVPGAPALPSQKGRDPRRPEEMETTESIAQEGDLAHDAVAKPLTEPSAETMPAQPLLTETEAPPLRDPQQPPMAETQPLPEPNEEKEAPKEVAKVEPSPPMIEGDVAVERAKPKDEIKPKKPPVEKMPEVNENQAASLPKPKEVAKETPKEPGFRGNQEKTKIQGSISRQGRSAQNVTNTAMGRYHAALSRAVEAEWHRNCTKYRDLITPGILTMRFVIDEKGSVRSVSVVEMVDASEVQKGFTLNAIRQAKIPPIPADLKKELDGEPLELIYNFYF